MTLVSILKVTLLLFLCFSDSAYADIKPWKPIADNLSNPSDSAKIVLVVDLASDSDLGIFANQKLLKKISSPLEFGFGGLFVLEKSDGRQKVVKLSRKYDSSIPYTAAVRHFDIGARELERFMNLEQAFYLWGQGTRESHFSALKLMEEGLIGFDNYQEIYDVLAPSYYQMLYELEDYSKVIQGNDRIGLCSTEFCKWKITLIKVSALRNIGEFDQAITLVRPLLNELNGLTDLPLNWQLQREKVRSELAASLMISGAFKRNQSRMEEAKKLLQRVRANAMELGDSRLAAIAMNNVSPYYFENGRNAEAEKLILESIALHRKVGVSKRLGDALNNLAYLYETDERADLAIDALSEALVIESRYPLRSEKGFLQLRLGTLYFNVGDWDSASLNFRSASESFASIGNQFYATIANVYLGTAYRNANMFEQALALHQTGAEFFKAKEHPNRYVNVLSELARDYISTLSNMGPNEKQQRRLDSTIRLLKKPELDLGNKEKVNLQVVLSEYYLFQNNHEMFSESIQQFKALTKVSDSKAYAEQRAAVLELEIRHALEVGNFDEVSEKADDFYRLARSKRYKLRKAALDSKWSHKVSHIVELHAEAVFKDWKKTNDKTKLHDLFDLLEGHNAISFRSSRNSAVVTQAYEPLGGMREVRDNEFTAVNGATKKQRQAARQRSTESRFKIESDVSPDLTARLVNLNIEQIQARLSDDEKVLRFYIRKNISLVFEILSNKWVVHELASRQEIETRVNSLLDEVSSRGKRSIEFTKALSGVLSWQKLNQYNARKVVYSADGVISRLPLAMLHTGHRDERLKVSLQQSDWIRTLSLSEYFSNSEQASKAQGVDIAIFADPVFNIDRWPNASGSSKTKSIVTNQIETFRSWSNTLQRLPGTAKEANFIKALYPNKNVKVITGSSATNQALLSEEFRSAKVVHIASHGYFSERTPNIVGIATTPVAGSHVNTGFLTLTELTRTTYRSNLVVVSGCETLLGEQLDGEGAMGLTRGVLSRGAGAVIGTLWSIPDRPTAYFMKLFYEHLKALEGNAASALTKAKLEMMENPRYRHAFYWAGYVLDSANQKYDSKVF